MAIVTMTQALKKLYKAVVGEDTEKNNPTKIVSDLAENYSGSGGGGGASGLVVNIVDNTEQTRLVLDKTWNEIKTAVTNGQVVWTLTEDVDYEDKYEAVAAIEHAITDGKYGVAVGYNNYSCDSADGYPYYYYGD